MNYIVIFLSLVLVELFFYKIAIRYKILDTPNKRSSHLDPTIRGAGIVIPISAIFFIVSYDVVYPWFLIAILLVLIGSFADDIIGISFKLRLVIYAIAIALLLLDIINPINFSVFELITIFIVFLGIINTFNFMDGINGMNFFYSLSSITVLLYINLNIPFIEIDLLISVALALAILGFLNFRNQAIAFGGDVGSISSGLILVFLIGKLMIETESLIWVLLLSIYGVDSILTIVIRITKGENIIKPHRQHLYQLLVNSKSMNHLLVSGIYGFMQIIVSAIILINFYNSFLPDLILSLLILLPLSLLYLIIRNNIIKSHLHSG